MPDLPSGKLKREVGLIGLCFVAVSGMLGAGWLFAPMLVSQEAGPAALLSWVIGGFMILAITLTFAEISSLLPIAGGIARLPHFSFGNVVSMAMGFSAWVGYSTNAPISAMLMLEYASSRFPWLYSGDASDHSLTLAGYAVASLIMLVMVLINVFGVRALATVNTGLTWFKILIPIVVSVAIISLSFETSNFFSGAGFSPYGFEGVLSGVATGGVVFAFIGFRHAIDLAGEVRNPKVTIPLALTLAVVICITIYGLVQVAFIGAVPADDLASGWAKLSFGHQLGPFAALAAALGLAWIGAVIYGGAIISPFGGALVSTGSNARLALGLSRNGFLSPFFDFLSRRGVPLRALMLNYVLGMFFLFLLPFQEMVSLNIATIVLTLCVGPLSVYTFRKQLRKRARGFLLPFVEVVAPMAFYFSILILYWAGWNTMWHLALVLAAGFLLFATRVFVGRSLLTRLDLREAIWLPPLLIGIWTISYFGNFGGGTGAIPFGWDLLYCGVLSIGVFFLADYHRLPGRRVRRRVAMELPPDPAE